MQTIPHNSVRPKRGKTKFYAGGAVIILAIAMLIVNGVRSGSYYLTLDELAERAATLDGRGVRVNAVVDKESVNYDSRAIQLTFDLVDPETGTRRTVVYNQAMPDTFMKSESVIVEGTVQPDGTLEAHTLLVKCPSKYEEAQAAGEAIPEDHLQTIP